MVQIEVGFQTQLKYGAGWVSFISAKGAVLIRPEIEENLGKPLD